MTRTRSTLRPAAVAAVRDTVRAVVLAVLLAACALNAGCGKYGPPRRTGEAPAPAVSAGHAPACENPEHDHDEPKPAEETP